MSIKALIWDFEGVLLQTNHESAPLAAAERLNVPPEKVKRVFFSEFNNRVDIGEFSQSDFWDHIIQTLELPQEKRVALEDFFYKDFFVDQELLKDIRHYRKQYKTGLLTNFSEVLRPMLTTQWKIDGAFDEIVISCEIGMVKPDPNIFIHILNRLGCAANEAIFIDDRILNIEGAEKAGLHAIHFTNRRETIKMINSIVNSYGSSLIH